MKSACVMTRLRPGRPGNRGSNPLIETRDFCLLRFHTTSGIQTAPYLMGAGACSWDKPVGV